MLLNYAPLREDELRNGGVAPSILNIGTRWTWSGQPHDPAALIPWEQSPVPIK